MKREAASFRRRLLALAAASVFVLPLAWTVAASLRQPGLPPPRTLEWLPDPAVWSNYRRIFEIVPLGRYALNSLIVTAGAVPLTVVSASWAGLALAHMTERWQRRWLAFTLALLMVPGAALWLTRFLLLARLGLSDNLAALAAPALMGSSPLYVLLFYWAFRRLPPELFDGARLEGAGPLTLWRRVALPLAGPATAAVAVLAFMLYWSDFTTPLLYLKAPARYTLSVGLQQLQQMDPTNWPLLMAAAVVYAGPPVGLFLLAQPFFLHDNWLRRWRRPADSQEV
jgi:multiple sugar transport system permease protein